MWLSLQRVGCVYECFVPKANAADVIGIKELVEDHRVVVNLHEPSLTLRMPCSIPLFEEYQSSIIPTNCVW